MKLIFGVGFNDRKYPSKIDSKHTPQYDAWRSMLRRCYSEEFHRKRPNYIGCLASDEFKTFSNFHDWFESQNPIHGVKYQLDKDLIRKGNKIYCENNCFLLPLELNALLVRKENKRGELPIGVSKRNDRDKFVSQLSYHGGNKTIGYFESEVDAFWAYKEEKERYIKLLANKHKYAISEKAYNALINYQVEITD